MTRRVGQQIIRAIKGAKSLILQQDSPYIYLPLNELDLSGNEGLSQEMCVSIYQELFCQR